MNDGLFHFKRFSVAHSHSSVKVGVDAVLIGRWADCNGDKLIDVGTGCGVIALMLAQRNSRCHVSAVDIDEKSVDEAAGNFSQSPWKERLSAEVKSFSEVIKRGELYDRIVSNPPYFDSGVTEFSSSRIVARHQGELSPSKLIEGAPRILAKSGKLSMIIPAVFFDKLVVQAKEVELHLARACFVKSSPTKNPKRVMMEFEKSPLCLEPDIQTMIMRDVAGDFTEEYISFGKDFYLKF